MKTKIIHSFFSLSIIGIPCVCVCVIPSLTSCSLNQQTNTITLPHQTNIGNVFDFQRFEEGTNTIYPEYKSEKMTSGVFTNPPDAGIVRRVIKDYVKPEQEFFSDELDITTTSSSFTILVRKNSYHYIYPETVTGTFPLANDFLTNLSSLPNKTIFSDFTGTPTKQDFVKA
ncbi:MAG: hypothetical protein LBC44_02335, partial [Mycoplasmataceae bacterium]|nr:hypothetical protein [Mycoplasmataceae bacterium]